MTRHRHRRRRKRPLPLDQLRPRWPRYVPDKAPPPRVLCVLGADHVQRAERGAGFRPTRAASFDAWCDIAFEWEAASWTAGGVLGVLGPEWIAAAIAQTKETRHERPHKQWCQLWLDRETGDVIGLCVARGSRRRWLADASVWGLEVPHNRTQREHFLGTLRRLFDLLGVGVAATPGGLGERTMVAEWGKEGADRRRWWPTARRCSHVLSRFGIGGRVGAYQQRKAFENAWELDQKNAYASAIVKVPAGQPHVHTAASADTWLLPASAPREPNATWFGYVAIRIIEDMDPADLLPLGIRRPTADDPRHLDWPHTAGTYCAWLWREEVEHIERRIAEGAPLQIIGIDEAWVWSRWSEQLAPWARRMDALRRDCDAQMADLVKRCIVAGIGHLAMPYDSRVLVREHEADPARGDVRWQPTELPESALWMRTAPREAANPIHWAVYAWMRCNLSITEAGHAEYLRGNRPLAVCTDCIILEKPPEATSWSDAPAMGEYGRAIYPRLVVVKPGVMFAPEKVRAPGMPKSVSRETLMRMGESPPPRRRRRDPKIDRKEAAYAAWEREVWRLVAKYWPDPSDPWASGW